MRDVARVLLAIAAALAALAAAACVALVVGEADRDARDGGLIAGGALLLLAALLLGARRLLRGERRPEAPAPAATPSSTALPVVLHPSRRRMALALVTCLVLAAFSAVIGLAEPVWLLLAAVLLACGVGAGVALTPGRVVVRLDEDGITYRAVLRTHRWRWDDVEGFRVVRFHHRYGTVEQVGFDERGLTHERQSWWQTLGRGAAGADRVLPAHIGGMDPEALAGLLGRLRERHATEHGPSPSARAEEALRRHAAAIPKDRAPVVTAVLAAACVAAFAWQVARAGWFPEAAELRDLGGASEGAAAWTLVTANVLHAHVVHLLLNLLALGVLGPLLERELGWPRTLLLAAAAGVGGTALSVVLHDGVTVGASAVVFGMLGWAVRRDVHRTRALGTVAWTVLPAALASTFFTPGTSIGGHLGGLAAGLLLAFALDRETGAPRVPAAT